jgi:hypothetical protein
LARAAAEQVGHAHLGYYPDLPYQSRFPGELTALVGELERCDYVPNADQVVRWLAATRCYRTQLAMLEEASGSLTDLVERLVAGGELALYERSDGPGIGRELVAELAR